MINESDNDRKDDDDNEDNFTVTIIFIAPQPLYAGARISCQDVGGVYGPWLPALVTDQGDLERRQR